MTTTADPHAERDAAPLAHAGDSARLHAWARAHVPGWPARLEHWCATRIAGGQSNPTWVVERNGAPAWVLRARPAQAAKLQPGAHAIEREFRVLRALHGTDVPVAQPLTLCEDERVIGAAFYVMDHVGGRVLRDARLPGMSVDERAAIHDDVSRVLAALHRVDWRARGLLDFGRADGYFDRLIARWSRQVLDAQADGQPPLEAMQRLIDELPARVPRAAHDIPAVLTHGDYRLENLIIDTAGPRVRAVLDWELSTLGHPLGDLGYHAMAWHLPADPLRGMLGGDGPGAGTPTVDQQIDRYLHHAGDRAAALRDAWNTDGSFYLGVQLFRLAAILQGIGHRHARGLAAHPQAAEMGRQAAPVAELALSVISGKAGDGGVGKTRRD